MQEDLSAALQTQRANGNTVIGDDALNSLTDGQGNTAIGYQALPAALGHYFNTATGYLALNKTITSGNVGTGAYALLNTTTGNFNTGIGHSVLVNNIDGADNTVMGSFAGDVITTGSNNTIIGHDADPSANSATNQIVIGYEATGLGNNYAVIGNADVDPLYAAQDGQGVLYTNGTIQSSDRRIKHRIADLGVGLDYVRRLRPVTYFKKHPSEYPQALKDKFYPNGHLRRSTPTSTTPRRWASLRKRSRP